MMDMQEFYRGASFDDYRYFGAQRAEKGFVFVHLRQMRRM